MSIIGHIIGSIVSKKVGKPIERSIQQGRENTNRRLGQEYVKAHIEKGDTYLKHVTVHIIIFIGLIVFFNIINQTEIATICGGIWVLFVLMPHIGATIFYKARWSEKELEIFDQEKDHEKRKRKSRFSLNFSKDWDE